jgi:hypothetical protein
MLVGPNCAVGHPNPLLMLLTTTIQKMVGIIHGKLPLLVTVIVLTLLR